MARPTGEGPTLEQFAEENPTVRGGVGFVRALPEDVRKQIDTVYLAGKATPKQITRWLLALGYKGATPAKVEHYIDGLRGRR